MEKANFLLKSIGLAALGLIISGCAPTIHPSSQASAQNVFVTNQAAPSTQCRFVGTINVRSVGPGPFTQDATQMNQDELFAIRNAALQLGANTVVVPPASMITMQGGYPSGHAFVANAYACTGYAQ